MYLNIVCNLWENCEHSVKCKKYKKAEGETEKSILNRKRLRSSRSLFL